MFVNIIKRLVAGMLCGCLTVATFCYDAAVQKAVSEDDGAIVINSQEDLEKLVDEGEEVKGIVITIAGGKATAAKYGEINEDTFKD